MKQPTLIGLTLIFSLILGVTPLFLLALGWLFIFALRPERNEER